ncbi:MAG: SufS family cysteine desulfurase [Gammaproteobacteria bacterium]
MVASYLMRSQVSRQTFDPYRVRRDFPILEQAVHGRPLVYLDNGATSQKPLCVIDALRDYYCRDNANVHRGVHTLSERATRAYEQARETAARFINAPNKHDVIFVRGTTEAINLVAQSYSRPSLRRGDEIVITEMEHHSNIVPWQMVCKQTGARLRVLPVDNAGEIHLDQYAQLLGPRTQLVAIVHLSNSLGTINPIEDMIAAAHARGIPVLVDGAQAIPHVPVDVQALGCDFYAFSGHKVYGPTGIGILYGKAELLEAMEPYQGGGEMIRRVTFEETSYNEVPYKFEAGTPNIAGAIGLATALEYVSRFGIEAVSEYEDALLSHATEAIIDIPGLRIIGTATQKAGILSFVMAGVHPHDIGTILDTEGVAIRAGHHCTMPLMTRYGIPGTARASFAMYNTKEDIDALVRGIEKVKEVFDR